MKKSIFRILLMAAGALHLLPYFAVPYAELKGLASGLGQLAGAFGMGDAYPEKLTGSAAVAMANMFSADEGFIKVLMLLPVVIGILVFDFSDTRIIKLKNIRIRIRHQYR